MRDLRYMVFTLDQAVRLARAELALAGDKPEVGMAALTHSTGLATTDPLRFECFVRAGNRARGAIELYERDPETRRMHRLGTSSFGSRSRGRGSGSAT